MLSPTKPVFLHPLQTVILHYIQCACSLCQIESQCLRLSWIQFKYVALLFPSFANRHAKNFALPLFDGKKTDQYIKIPFETFSSWVVMPATAAGDPVNSGIGIGTGRNERKLGCLEKDPPMGHSWRWTGSCRAVRMRSQVEPGVARRSPLPGSSCHAVMPHPGERATKQLKLVGTLSYTPKLSIICSVLHSDSNRPVTNINENVLHNVWPA